MRLGATISFCGRRRGAQSIRTWAILVCATAALVAACGGSDGCGGFISINASPERCMALAEQFGCEGFEATEGPSCGLVACARCEGEE